MKIKTVLCFTLICCFAQFANAQPNYFYTLAGDQSKHDPAQLTKEQIQTCVDYYTPGKKDFLTHQYWLHSNCQTLEQAQRFFEVYIRENGPIIVKGRFAGWEDISHQANYNAAMLHLMRIYYLQGKFTEADRIIALIDARQVKWTNLKDE